MSPVTKRKTRNTVTLSKKKYEELKKASEELDTLKAILLYEEEKKAENSNLLKKSVI